MRELHIVMPMAGEGSRFKSAGWTTPKPLIQLNGLPLFIRAVNSIQIADCRIKHTFIVRQEHIDNNSIDKMIRAVFPDANIFSVSRTTRGAVETCLIAEAAILDNDAVLVLDCDLEFSAKRYMEIIREQLAQDDARGGALVSFRSDSPRYSYAEVDDNDNVIRTAEKKVISNNALCGAYFFSSGKQFKKIAKELISSDNNHEPEFYISLLYNILLAAGDTVKLAHLDRFDSYGTPEELQRYLQPLAL